MEKQNLMEIPLGEVMLNPLNPRKEIAGPKLDELVASVKQFGVLEPIIVRRVQRGYEVVAGERRLRAAKEAGLVAVPAIVRVLTDLEAYEIMVIENLQREDLTEAEQAESFQGFIEKHRDRGKPEDETALLALAEKTGLSPRYIRGRVAVLSLPKRVLDAWRAENVCFGHLQQLLRVKDPKRQAELLRYALADREGEGESVAQIKERIDREAVSLVKVPFDRSECGSCPRSTVVQQDLFGLGPGKALCTDPACFKKKLNAWLGAHWKETEAHKRSGAPAFRFEDSLRVIQYESFYGGIPAKCKACEKFVAVLESDGSLHEYSSVACLGDKGCMRRAQAEKARTGSAKAGKPAARPDWHGEYFRDRFFRGRIPAVISGFDGDSETIKRLLLSSLVQESDVAAEAVAKELHIRVSEWGIVDGGIVFKAIMKAPWKSIIPLLRAAAAAVLLEGEADRYARGNFSPAERQAAGEYMGISVAKEFAMDEEYLTRKTRAEILAFGKKLKLFDDQKMRAYLARKKAGKPEALKKGELVDAVLKSGIKLVGRVPDEILKAKP